MTDILIQYKEKKEKEQNTFPEKVENFKNKLKEIGLKSFEVQYSGSGDSGEIEEINYEPNFLQCDIDVGTWRRWNIEKMEHEETEDKKPLKDYIEDFCYDLLEVNHGGWEINEGQSGNIQWDNDGNQITHGYTCYIEQSNEEEY